MAPVSREKVINVCELGRWQWAVAVTSRDDGPGRNHTGLMLERCFEREGVPDTKRGNEKSDLTGEIREAICSQGLTVGCRGGVKKEAGSAVKIFGHCTGSIVTAHYNPGLNFPISAETE